jgi:hypothetical protein
VNEREFRDLQRWYQHTFVRINGITGELRSITNPTSSVAEIVLQQLEFPHDSKYVRISSLQQIEPLSMSPTLVDTGTPIGVVFVTRNTLRQYKKSLCDDILHLPDYAEALLRQTRISVPIKSIIRSHLLGKLRTFGAEEAAARVVAGAALFSAVTNEISIGVLPNQDRYVATKRDAVVGTFLKRKNKSPVGHLVLTEPNEHLVDEFAKYIHTVEVA